MSAAQPSPHSRPSTLDDVARVDGKKAELIGDRIVLHMPTGHQTNQIVGEIFVALKLHVRATGRGRVARGDSLAGVE